MIEFNLSPRYAFFSPTQIAGNVFFDNLEKFVEYDIFIRGGSLQTHLGAKINNEFINGPFSLNARIRTKEDGINILLLNSSEL